MGLNRSLKPYLDYLLHICLCKFSNHLYVIFAWLSNCHLARFEVRRLVLVNKRQIEALIQI